MKSLHIFLLCMLLSSTLKADTELEETFLKVLQAGESYFQSIKGKEVYAGAGRFKSTLKIPGATDENVGIADEENEGSMGDRRTFSVKFKEEDEDLITSRFNDVRASLKNAIETHEKTWYVENEHKTETGASYSWRQGKGKSDALVVMTFSKRKLHVIIEFVSRKL